MLKSTVASVFNRDWTIPHQHYPVFSSSINIKRLLTDVMVSYLAATAAQFSTGPKGDKKSMNFIEAEMKKICSQSSYVA